MSSETTRPNESTSEPLHPAATPAPPPTARRSGFGLKRALFVLVFVGIIAAAAVYGYPALQRSLTTVSTDDAYVNSHVTYVAPRIPETVTEVKVDNNDYVRKGDLIVALDRTAWTIRVAQSKAALDAANKGLAQQLSKARASAAEARADRFKLASAMTSVRNQEAELRSAIASLNEKRAAEALAKQEADRYKSLAAKGSITQEQADIRKTDYDQARASAISTLEKISGLRVALEVPETPPSGKLDELPPNLDQVHSTVSSALAAFSLDIAELGLGLPRANETPNQFLDRIHKAAPNGSLDVLIEQTVEQAPGVELARSQIEQAKQDLAMSELQLSYCEIYAEIDGFVSNRNVNVGDRVSQGQKLFAIRSYKEVWIDCNFKETQLPPIRIGHPVDLYLDAYPGKVFKGRVSGFSAGTGASLALLPAQNATGNFVKIVQRLPVRVDLVDGNPTDTPLFVGLSVVPYILINQTPEGPNANQRLRGDFPKTAESKGK
ncbi:HlyD family secretion protein [Singulisphaera sp. PoT]|uniref:HlyD family secretion protein n=1 Tax=Singulisphaera sp. PoT TaxID=3411797 RepID=UPI003BF4988D